MKKSLLNLITVAVLGVVFIGCGSLQKSSTIDKTVQNNNSAEKEANMLSDKKNTDSIMNLLSSLHNPLILANGIEIPITVLAGMKVEDIQSFSIYTDADAIKMYGTRGTNGVIVIKSNLRKRELKKRIKEVNKKSNEKQ